MNHRLLYRLLRDGPHPNELPGRLLAVRALIISGMTNKEIGARLKISESTVKAHVARLSSIYGTLATAEALRR